jgi:hypothetical protein
VGGGKERNARVNPEWRRIHRCKLQYKKYKTLKKLKHANEPHFGYNKK